MKEKGNYISRILAVLLLGLVLCFHSFGSSMIQKNVVSKIEQASKEQKQQDDSNKTTISELQHDVVVPSHAFDFQNAVVIPQPRFEVYFEEKQIQTLTKPIYSIAFFEKLFTHHIATNAP